jgi:hypothetical protein
MEKVMTCKDGNPEFKDMPGDLHGSGETIEE